MGPPKLGSFISIPFHKEDPFFQENSSWPLDVPGTDTKLARGRGAQEALLVVGRAAFPFAVTIHATGAEGAGE